MVLGTSRRIAIFKIATLQRQSHLQSCNVPFRQVTMQSFGGVQGRPFQRHVLLGSSPQAAGAKSHSPRGEIPPIAGEMSAKQTKGAWVRRTAIASFDGRRLSKVLLRYS